MAEIIGVRFKDGGKQYYFDPCGASVRKGQGVIIETSRGIEYGECVKENTVIPDEALVAPLRPLIRLATEEDKLTVEKNKEREERAFRICQQKIEEHGLDMKLVEVEYSFEGNKVLFFFTSEGRVDFRALVKDLAAIFHTRIELRQIGVRDEAKILGGLGICGKPFCCSSFLDEFQPVSIKMAKTQNLSLNPTKISGTCGRLMCCLKYEQEAYEDALKRCPKMDSFVETPDGVGTVTGVNLLREKIKVRMDDAPDTQKCYYGCEICVVRSGKGKRPEDYVPPSPEELAKRRMQRPAKPEDEPSAKREEEAQQPTPRGRFSAGHPSAAEQPAPATEQERGQRRGRGHGKPGRQEQKSAPASEKPAAQPQAANADAKEKNGGKRPRSRRRWHKPKPGGETKK
jgi:cell fate regulator YaaT (PSP1 superfamily)